jgi:superfamily II DNA/RNA helicase
MQSTGPDLTEIKTASREPTDAELPLAHVTVADTTAAAVETPASEEPAPAEPAPAEPAQDEPTPDELAGASDAEPSGPDMVESEVVPQAEAEAAPVDDDRHEDDDGDLDDRSSSQIPIVEGLPPEPARPLFSDLGLSEEVLRAIADMGYRHPTPIQEQAIPYVLMGRDVMGTAQTGTGKTAGFTLPMLDILSGSRARARMPRSLILEPTRELALQVAENFVQYGKYLKLTHALIIGGESMSDQKDVLNRGVDVLIATPGRLLDMFDRGSILLTDTRILVIDEADRMLDMGFIPDVERIVSMLPKTRQTLFFSATMGPEIRRLVDAFLTNPKEIAVSRAASVATTITEGLALVAEHDKREALRRLIRSQNVQNALIFCNRKRDVDILHKSLTKHHFDAGALHGDMAQTVRFSTLEKFKANELRLLVCSDVAARGLDIGGLSHVFNFDVPIHAEDYVHRIGRTGRAGLEGKAFTIASPEDRYAVEQIEKLISHPIPPIIVEGLDPVDWTEGRGKRRGRKVAEPKKAASKAKPREAKDKDEKPRMERVRPERARTERQRPERQQSGPAAQPELPVMAEERPSRRDEPRRDEPRRDEPRRDDYRRERYRRDDDLGPAVVGFGDDVPAFMFLRARSVMTENRESDA